MKKNFIFQKITEVILIIGVFSLLVKILSSLFKELRQEKKEKKEKQKKQERKERTKETMEYENPWKELLKVVLLLILHAVLYTIGIVLFFLFLSGEILKFTMH